MAYRTPLEIISSTTDEQAFEIIRLLSVSEQEREALLASTHPNTLDLLIELLEAELLRRKSIV